MTLKISVPKPPPAPVLPPDVAPDLTLLMEKHPRIGNKIAIMWGSVELQKYLNNLIIDERGDRQGFPKESAAALMRIHRYHGKIVPEDDKHVWNKVIY